MSWRDFRSPAYNWRFNTETGLFLRWGETLDDDPEWSPFGPELADIEISTGDCSAGCPWCYKSNERSSGKHMGLDTFRLVLDALPETLTQVAFGITDANANPDFIGMMELCRERDVAPNYTTSGFGLSDEVTGATAQLCGAVAVSVYPHNKDLAWNTVRRFVELGMDQVNVHLLYHSGNGDFVRQVLSEAPEGLNAVVLLGLKPKGRAESTFQPMGYEEFAGIVSSTSSRIGFDSCSAPKFERWAREAGREDLLVFSEPCESSLFSVYVDVDGNAWPCSFGEGHADLEPTRMNDNFLETVWNGPVFNKFRSGLLANGRRCPLYSLDK